MEHFGIILSMTTGYLHKKLVLNEIFNIFHKITHISFDIGFRMKNFHTLGHPFPLLGLHESRMMVDFIREYHV